MVHGLPHFIVSNVSYVVSIYGKHHCEPFPSQATHHATSILELVHIYLRGPMRTQLLEVCDISFLQLMNFHAKFGFTCVQPNLKHSLGFRMVVQLTRRPPRRFEKSDLTMVVSLFQMPSITSVLKEVCSSVFCLQLSTNKMNSRKEEQASARKWLERCCLSLIFPLSFGVEDVRTNVHIINCCSTKTVAEMICEEAFTDHNLSVSHLSVFGSDAFIYISDKKQIKFESKSKKCKFLGYSSHSKAYQTKFLSFLELFVFQSHNLTTLELFQNLL